MKKPPMCMQRARGLRACLYAHRFSRGVKASSSASPSSKASAAGATQRADTKTVSTTCKNKRVPATGSGFGPTFNHGCAVLASVLTPTHGRVPHACDARNVHVRVIWRCAARVPKTNGKTGGGVQRMLSARFRHSCVHESASTTTAACRRQALLLLRRRWSKGERPRRPHLAHKPFRV